MNKRDIFLKVKAKLAQNEVPEESQTDKKPDQEKGQPEKTEEPLSRKEQVIEDTKRLYHSLKENDIYKRDAKKVLQLVVTFFKDANIDRLNMKKIFEFLRNKKLVYLPNSHMDKSLSYDPNTSTFKSKKYVWEWTWAKILVNFGLKELVKDWGLNKITEDKDFDPKEEVKPEREPVT